MSTTLYHCRRRRPLSCLTLVFRFDYIFGICFPSLAQPKHVQLTLTHFGVCGAIVYFFFLSRLGHFCRKRHFIFASNNVFDWAGIDWSLAVGEFSIAIMSIGGGVGRQTHCTAASLCAVFDCQVQPIDNMINCPRPRWPTNIGVESGQCESADEETCWRTHTHRDARLLFLMRSHVRKRGCECGSHTTRP